MRGEDYENFRIVSEGCMNMSEDFLKFSEYCSEYVPIISTIFRRCPKIFVEHPIKLDNEFVFFFTRSLTLLKQ